MYTEDSHHLWNEALGADGIFASATNEAFLVPLSALVLHLLHPRLKYYLPQHPNLWFINKYRHCWFHLEDVSTGVTPAGELGVVTRPAIDSVSLRTKLLVDQAPAALHKVKIILFYKSDFLFWRNQITRMTIVALKRKLHLVAKEAGLVPVLLFVRKILEIQIWENLCGEHQVIQSIFQFDWIISYFDIVDRLFYGMGGWLDQLFRRPLTLAKVKSTAHLSWIL